jgi:O-succinylbenzoate synthase
MKIERITLREIRIPLVHFFETSFGRTTERRILLVSIDSEGTTGWGECTAGENPFFSEESIDTAWSVTVDFLVPSLLGKQLSGPADAIAPMAPVRGHRMAKASIENALWHLEAIQKNVPLWKLVGGTRPRIDCGVSIGIQNSIEQLLEKIATEVGAGYRRIKLKVKPGWDLNVLERVRAQFPKISLSVDANSAYTLEDFDHLRRFDAFDLLMIEQPLWHDDFYFHAKLQEKIKTALCLDEAIHHARAAQAALELTACRIINIKLGRVGGFTEAKRVHDVAQSNGVPVWCGGMLESGIGRAHNIAMSTLENFRLPGDVSASKRYWKEDIIDPEVTVSPEGDITVPQSPGLGFAIKEELIDRWTVRREEFRAGAQAGTH